MKFATIDIGSNTVRMLIGSYQQGVLQPYRYERCITRLAGQFSTTSELAAASIERTCAALVVFSELLKKEHVPCLRAVGTAALRRANNRQLFIDRVYQQTGFKVEVIDGDEEARLMASGALSVINPPAAQAVIFDIGGGSTEIVCSDQGHILFQHSYPVGVVKLAEECATAAQRRQRITDVTTHFIRTCPQQIVNSPGIQLIGTAGTLTTLAAIDLALTSYDASLVNNHKLDIPWLEQLYQHLEPLTPTQRETIPGMEPGRGDLMPAGIEIALALAQSLGLTQITVSDAGLLEGVLMDACRD